MLAMMVVFMGDANMLEMNKCECVDPGCPVHIHGHCVAPGKTILYRVDMVDRTGTVMCDPCAGDALESGLFREDD